VTLSEDTAIADPIEANATRVHLQGSGFAPDTDVSLTVEGPGSQHSVITADDASSLHATPDGEIGPWSFFFDDPQTDVGEWTLTASDGTCETDVSLEVRA
jgi:hypothetical protein